MTISMDEIKKLRKKTGAGVMDAKKALEESKGNIGKAEEWIAKKGLARAEKKSDRETSAGAIYAYSHHNGSSATLVELNCETDFVAKTDDFMNLAKEVAMQVNSMGPETVADLLSQEYVRDPSITVEELIKQTSGKLGENIKLKRFQRFELGEK
jgi:elongation factor Ts